MGNRQSILEQISIYKPPFQDLVLKDSGNLFKIYKHKYKGYELMAHKTTLNSQKQLPVLIDNFKARYQHHYLVSTLFLACEDYSACGGYYETIVFYQRIFTNLSKIKDIPFHDVLHFYAVAFKGFQILFRRFGYFQIYEDMFHLGQDSKLKVWCHRDISKSEPETYLLDKNGTEQDMLRKIIFIISENTDTYTDKLNLKEKLHSYGLRNFQMANQSLRQICRQYNLSVPERLLCISSLPSEEVKLMLDLYTSNVKDFSQNQPISDLTVNSNTPLPVPSSPNNSAPLIDNLHSQGHTNGLMTPHFQRPQIPHVPITQQFMIQQPLHQLHNLNVQHGQRKQTQQSMIHTFNRRPQMPQTDQRRGIQLSLGQNRERKPSWHSNKKLSQSRNKSLPLQNNTNLMTQNNPKCYSLQKKPQIKINFVSQKNAWMNPQTQAFNVSQRFDKSLYPQQVRQTISRPQNQQRQNYFIVQQQNQVPKIIQPSRSRVMFAQHPVQQYYSQPHSSQHQQNIVNNSTLLHNSTFYKNNAQRPIEVLKKSNHSIQISQPTFQKSYSSSNLYAQPSKPTYQPLLSQLRQRRASSKNNNSNNQTYLQSAKKQVNEFVNPSEYLQRNVSTPVLNKVQANDTYKKKENPFETVQNGLKSPQTPANHIQGTNFQSNKFHLQVPLNPPISPQFNAHSASSRYLYSNKQLNDNIPDIRYKKVTSPKKTLINKLFDTKMQQLQSFNQSKFGTQNSLKEPYAENSRVLEIIGREKKDSITSAFGDQQSLKKNDEVKESGFQNKKYQLKLQSNYKYGDSFTDPKILEILKRPSSKALKTELNNIKKVSTTAKTFDFSQQIMKKPFISKQVRQDMLKLESWQSQGERDKYSQKNNHQNFQGFPSLSNLSQINKVEQNSFNDEKTNLVLSNKKNLSRKSRFSEEKLGSAKKEQNAVSEFYQFDYQSPTYEYSFSSKRQVPIQDNEWRAKYATTINSSKDDSTMVHNKTNDFRVVPEKPFSYLTGFNSNQSLASLEFELSQKLSSKNAKDQIKQSIENSNQFSGFKNSSSEVTSTGASRKYNPKIDPQISRDLERFRKQKRQIKNN